MPHRDTNDTPTEKPVPEVNSVPESDLSDPGNQSSYKQSIDSRANPEAAKALPEVHIDDDKSNQESEPGKPGSEGQTPNPEQPLKVETDEKGNTRSTFPDGRTEEYDRQSDTTVTQHPDGRVVIKSPETYISGKVVEPKRYQESTHYPDGQNTVTKENGTKYHYVPGQGVEIERPDGTVEQHGKGRVRIYEKGTIQPEERRSRH